MSQDSWRSGSDVRVRHEETLGGWCSGQSTWGWVCYPAEGGAGLVCYHAVWRAGLGLLSRCWSRAGFVIPLLYVWLWSWLLGWDRAGFVIPLSEQGWVYYPAAGAGLGLLSRCCTSGFDRDCVVETGLGLLSRCRSRAGFVIPLLEQGWVCYPAAVRPALIVIVWLRQGWVCYPAVGAGLGLLSRCWSRAGFVIPLLYVRLWSWLCGWDRAGFVIPLSEQGWVCYPAAVRLALIAIVWWRQGWGLLSRCRSRAGFVIPLLEQGWVCYPAAVRLALIAIVWWRQGWGLLSRCRSRAGFVIPLLEQGWVCYPAAVGLALIAIVWLRQGWVCYPAPGAGGVVIPLLYVWLWLRLCGWDRAGFVIPL